MNIHRWFFSAAILLSILNVRAAVIGTNTPALSLTMQRVANLPRWEVYLENSMRQRQADREFLQTEMKANHLTKTTEPKAVRNAAGLSLTKPAEWYGDAEARRLADNLVSFQTPAGGWCKNTDFTGRCRAPGEVFGAETGSLKLSANDFDRPSDARWSYVGTFDNDATTTELRFLAKVISANSTNTNCPVWNKAFMHGLDYIFAAQFPNGGWPQVWPLQGGYHDAVTFNDDAMLSVIELLHDVATGEMDYTFVPAEMRARAAASMQRGIDCVLAAQIRVGGRRTVWCQQHDALTLQPVSARNYEMPSQASGESGNIVLFLMRLPNPDSNVVAAVKAASAWFEQTKIMGKAFKNEGAAGRMLEDAPGNGPIWARYYEIGTDLPIYGDRDQTIHDNVNEISQERRKGYRWFNDTGKRVLEHYQKWAKAHS